MHFGIYLVSVTTMKRARVTVPPIISDESPDASDGSNIDDEAVAEALAAGVITRPAKRLAVDNKPALRAALASFAADLPWIERLEVVSAEPLAIDGKMDDLKMELALCVV
jgi:hypothetical protein